MEQSQSEIRDALKRKKAAADARSKGMRLVDYEVYDHAKKQEMLYGIMAGCLLLVVYLIIGAVLAIEHLGRAGLLK